MVVIVNQVMVLAHLLMKLTKICNSFSCSGCMCQNHMISEDKQIIVVLRFIILFPHMLARSRNS